MKQKRADRITMLFDSTHFEVRPTLIDKGGRFGAGQIDFHAGKLP